MPFMYDTTYLAKVQDDSSGVRTSTLKSPGLPMFKPRYHGDGPPVRLKSSWARAGCVTASMMRALVAISTCLYRIQRQANMFWARVRASIEGGSLMMRRAGGRVQRGKPARRLRVCWGCCWDVVRRDEVMVGVGTDWERVLPLPSAFLSPSPLSVGVHAAPSLQRTRTCARPCAA